MALFCLLAVSAVLATGVTAAEETGNEVPAECSTPVSLGDLYASAQLSSNDQFGGPFNERRRGWNGGQHDGDDDDDDDDDDLICLCHVPKGNPDGARTICVGPAAACAHLKHGDKLGPCAETCGGEEGDTCDEGQFCKIAAGECSEDAEGTCTKKPTKCPDHMAPVCGCDQVTYDNLCLAAAAGVNVAAKGACVEPTVCGGTEGITCGDGEFCIRDTGMCADEDEGVCVEKPPACPPVVEPVCGCDSRTYTSDCEAARSGMSVDAPGTCGSPPADTGVIDAGPDAADATTD